MNEKGEQTITYWLPIPKDVDPKDYDVLASLVEREMNEKLQKLMLTFQ